MTQIIISILTEIIIPLILISLFCYAILHEKLHALYREIKEHVKIRYYWIKGFYQFVKYENLIERYNDLYMDMNDREGFDLSFNMLSELRYENIEFFYDKTLKTSYFICDDEIIQCEELDSNIYNVKLALKLRADLFEKEDERDHYIAQQLEIDHNFDVFTYSIEFNNKYRQHRNHIRKWLCEKDY